MCAPARYAIAFSDYAIRVGCSTHLCSPKQTVETNKRSREERYYRLVTLFYYFCLAIMSFRTLRRIPFFPRDTQQVERTENGTVSNKLGTLAALARTNFTMDVAICFFLFQARLLPKEVYSPVSRLDRSPPLPRPWISAYRSKGN